MRAKKFQKESVEEPTIRKVIGKSGYIYKGGEYMRFEMNNEIYVGNVDLGQGALIGSVMNKDQTNVRNISVPLNKIEDYL